MTEQLKSGLGLEIGDEVRVLLSSSEWLGKCRCDEPKSLKRYPEFCAKCKMHISQGEKKEEPTEGTFIGLYPHFKSAELVLVEMHHDGGTYVFRHSDVRRVDDRAA